MEEYPRPPPETSSINQEDSPPSKRACKQPGKPPQQPGKARKISPCWAHFTPIKNSAGDTIKAFCNYCLKEYAAGSGSSGTSNLLKHTKVCKENPENNEQSDQKTLDLHVKPGVGVELVATTFTFEAAKRALAEMIVIDELPFNFVEGYGFRRFCNALQPKFFPIPSRNTISREVWAIYRNEKERLMKQMKGRRICFTTDTWTSIQNLCYMCLTAHYIDDDWNLQKRIINFCLVEDHKGETVGRRVEQCLLDWNIDSMFTLTVDNASSNSLTIKFLVGATKDWKGTILEHEFLHVRCCAHILNLIVGDGLKEMDSSIANIRHAVRYVRSSPNRNDNFLKFVEKCKIVSKSHLCLDVPTRWNSCYKMLEHAERFEKAFERMGNDDEQFKAYFKDREVGGGGGKQIPTKDDWDTYNEGTPMVTDNDDDDPYSLILSQYNTYLEGQSFSSSMSELDKYLGDDVVSVPIEADFDILGWWKNTSSKYRVLSQVARDVLAMPVSTVASESAFSTGGRILDPFRSSLHPATVEMLVCTQNWLQSNHRICLRKAMDDVEQIEETMEESSTCSSPAPTSGVINVE